MTITLPPMSEDQDYWYIGDEHAMYFRVNANGVVEEIEIEEMEDFGDLVIAVTNWTNH